MSVPPQVMQALQAARQGGGAPTPPGGQPPGGASQAPTQPPMASGMTTPQQQAGRQTMGHVQVQIAMQVLEQALPMLGSGSKEGAAVIRSLDSLAKTFGNKDNGDLVPAQILSMVQQMPQMGGGAPLQRQILQQMQQGAQGAPPGAGAQPGQPQAA